MGKIEVLSSKHRRDADVLNVAELSEKERQNLTSILQEGKIKDPGASFADTLIGLGGSQPSGVPTGGPSAKAGTKRAPRKKAPQETPSELKGAIGELTATIRELKMLLEKSPLIEVLGRFKPPPPSETEIYWKTYHSLPEKINLDEIGKEIKKLLSTVPDYKWGRESTKIDRYIMAMVQTGVTNPLAFAIKIKLLVSSSIP